jgi:hypothetical protein
MSEIMTRFLTFLFVLGGLFYYFYKTTQPKEPAAKQLEKKNKSRSKKQGLLEEIWAQVYDTDSSEEAQKIKSKFQDLGIPCLLYEQGKKDVYGAILKHFGISVSKRDFSRAQHILSENIS